jgi:hypothetical protein
VTWRDVDWLRHEALMYDLGRWHATAERFRDLADRIARQLPPREFR